MDQDENIQHYEIAFLLKEEADLAALKEVLRAHGANTTFEGPMKKIALAYEIEKQTVALFSSIQFKAPTDQIESINHTLTLRKTVIRFLIVKCTPGKTPQVSPVSVLPVVEESISPATPTGETYSGHSLPLSNEDLEKKIEEILK
ncbi:MAG: 30S ribosomal protein S6 [Patescibacteria group bacterium]